MSDRCSAGTGTATPGGQVALVLPGDVRDPSRPSGGNAYDLRLCAGLRARGWRVEEILAPGEWPRPAESARAELARSLRALPDGSRVLLDGLVACGVPEIVTPVAARLRLAVLVHLPLADETGLAPEVAAELDRRERETLRAASAVIATSRWAADRLVARHALPADRVHVVVPGTEPAPLAAGTDTGGGLLCVASITRRKGQDVLVEALARLADLPWRCACVGPNDRDPDYVRQVRQLIDRSGLAGRVELVGPRTGAELERYYAAADLLVLPSRAETYGMVVVEALARGIPVVASSVGGVPDALGRVGGPPEGELPGVLVPPDDPAALAAALRDWLTTPSVRDRLRRAARARRGSLEPWTGTCARMANVLAALPTPIR